nr:hypothetical transcript [Hymenolepis microstoma]
MEKQLIEKMEELKKICKETVEAERNCSSSVLTIDWSQAKTHKPKFIAEQKKRLTRKLQEIFNEAESLQKILLKAQGKILEIQSIENKIKLVKGPKNMRRGVLMSLLQESAKSIPMWAGVVDQSSLVASGDYVAALVPDLDCPDAEFVPNESWILAEVISFSREKKNFQVEDVDAEEGKVRYTLDRSKVILLPKWKANPILNPEAIFRKGTLVLALYPQTTCFYRAVVDTHPMHAHDDYSLYFEDPSYPDGYAPSIRIPQRYVIFCPECDRKSTRHSRGRFSGAKN